MKLSTYSVENNIVESLTNVFTGGINIIGAKFNSDSDLSFKLGLNESNDIKSNIPSNFDTTKSLTFSLNLTTGVAEKIELTILDLLLQVSQTLC